MMNTLKELLNNTKLWILYKHNKRKMQACLREVGFGEFWKSGFRVRYPTFYSFNYFEKTRDNYKPSKKETEKIKKFYLWEMEK